MLPLFLQRLALGPAWPLAALPAWHIAMDTALVGFALWAGWRLNRALHHRTDEWRASEERFRALFENAVEGIYENPAEGGFRRANPAMARILGYPSVAALLQVTPAATASIYVSPTRRQEFFVLLGASDYITDFESEIRRPDGSTAWIKENVRAVRDAGGKLLYLQGFVSDISGRKQAEDALRASEERYRVLFEHSPIGIVEYDYRPIIAWLEGLRADGVADLGHWFDEHPSELEAATSRIVIVGANSATLRLAGVTTLAEGIANLSQLFTSEVFAARRKIFEAMWDGRSDAEGEFTFRSLTGTSRRVFYRWWLPRLEGRQVYERAQLALVDITAVKSAEQALAAERERLSVTLRTMTEAVVTADSAGNVQFMNAAASDLTGWPVQAAVGRPLGEVCLLSHERAAWIATPMSVALAADGPIDLLPHTKLQKRGGPARLVQGQCAPMHDHTGRAMGAVLVLRDVTESSRLEGELMRASKLESVGVLAGGIAHDFNNLLSIVIGNLTLALLDEQTAAAGGRWLREAERGTQRARELTQQLLTFAKGGDPVRAAVRLADVVRDAAEFALHGTAVRCEFDLASDLRPADVDKGQIGQVVHNLVINAVQAMPAGGVIRLRLHNEKLGPIAMPPLPAGDYLRLEITDTGKGIPAEHLTHVFEPFFTTKEHGSGLGLATVYSVIRKHSGHVVVESVVGTGTTFRIWLPAAQEEPPPVRATNNPLEPLQGRVLFMDDEEAIRTMTQALLARLGLETVVTADGGEAVRQYALARMAGQPFDLVIMDLTVPGAMGGADAMREILKIDPDAKGIVSSGYSSDPVMANFKAHGFRGMVPKPYRISDFSRTIREVLLKR
jgi:PAS domain S-box-containing protein